MGESDPLLSPHGEGGTERDIAPYGSWSGGTEVPRRVRLPYLAPSSRPGRPRAPGCFVPMNARLASL
jgi:hypothetical protein